MLSKQLGGSLRSQRTSNESILLKCIHTTLRFLHEGKTHSSRTLDRATRLQNSIKSSFQDTISFDNDFSDISTGPVAYKSVIRDVTNAQVKRSSYAKKSQALFETEDSNAIPEENPTPRTHSNKGNRFRAARNIHEDQSMYSKTFIDEIQADEAQRTAKKKNQKNIKEFNEKMQRAQQRAQPSPLDATIQATDSPLPPIDQDASLQIKATPEEMSKDSAAVTLEIWPDTKTEKIRGVNEIIQATTTSSILAATATHLNDFDALAVCIAVHRLGKTVTPINRASLRQDPRFQDLLKATEEILPVCEPRGLASIFWALVRLEYAPKWMDKLVDACVASIDRFERAHVGSLLHCLSRVNFSLEKTSVLRERLLARLKKDVGGEWDALDVTCVLTALARMKVSDIEIFGPLATTVSNDVSSYDMGQLCSISWAFASLNLTDRTLMANIRNSFQHNCDKATPKDLLQIVWSLARLGEFDEDLFQYTLAPLIRSFLLSYNAKELSSLIWSFSQSGMDDADFFADLSSAMIPKVRLLTTHELASVVLAFSNTSHNDKELFKLLKQQIIHHCHFFNPTQLSKCIYGLAQGGVTDLKAFNTLANLYHEKMSTATHHTTLLVLKGLKEVEYLSHDSVEPLLSSLSPSLSKLSLEDSITLLQILSSLPSPLSSFSSSHPSSPISPSTYQSYLTSILENIHSREKKWSLLRISHAIQLLEALHDLRHSDPLLLQLLLSNLHSFLKDATSSDFVRLIGSLAYLPLSDRLLWRSHIVRRPELQAAFDRFLETLSQQNVEDFSSRIVLLYATTRLNYENRFTQKMLEDVLYRLDAVASAGQVESFPSPSLLCYFLWIQAQLNSDPLLTKKLIRSFLSQRYCGETCGEERRGEEREGEIDEERSYSGEYRIMNRMDPFANVPLQKDHLDAAEALLRVVWSFFALRGTEEEERFEQLVAKALEDLAHAYDGKIPKELEMIQQVGFQILHLEREEWDQRISQETKKWIQFCLDCPRVDLYNHQHHITNPNFSLQVNQKIKAKQYNYDQWLSEALVTLKVGHKQSQVIKNLYRVPITFPTEKSLIDVIALQDFLTPTNRPLLSCEFRQRQLALQGWTIHSVHLKTLYDVRNDNALRTFVANIVKNFESVRQRQDWIPKDQFVAKQDLWGE